MHVDGEQAGATPTAFVQPSKYLCLLQEPSATCSPIIEEHIALALKSTTALACSPVKTRTLLSSTPERQDNLDRRASHTLVSGNSSTGLGAACQHSLCLIPTKSLRQPTQPGCGTHPAQ